MGTNCNCDYSQQPSYSVAQCVSCSSCTSTTACSKEITQKRIWNQVRTPTSLYMMNMGALTSAAEHLQYGPQVNWNQRSDRQNASVQTASHPSHGNSTRTSLTRERPGACAPAGKGVDIKHDSYARYLNRKKSGNLRAQPVNTWAAEPHYGNKTYATNSVATSIDCNCTLLETV